MALITIGNNNIYVENASQIAALSTSSSHKVFGTAGLRCNRNGTSGRWWNIARSTTPRRFQSGLISGWIRLVSIAAGTQDRVGFYFDASAEDLSGASGTVYALLAEVVNTQATIQIVSSTTGVSGLSTIRASGATLLTIANGDVLAMVVRYIYSADLGGIWVRGYWQISATDLPAHTDSDTPAVEFTISTAAPSTQGEGECIRMGTTGSAGDYVFDRITRTPYAVGAL